MLSRKNDTEKIVLLGPFIPAECSSLLIGSSVHDFFELTQFIAYLTSFPISSWFHVPKFIDQGGGEVVVTYSAE